MAIDGKGIIKDFDPVTRKSVGTGYVIVPGNVDRTKFIERCLRTERFSILVEGGGGVLHKCYATKSALRDIRFPQGNDALGSGVVFFVDPHAGKAVIVGVVGVDGKADLNREDAMVLRRTHGGNHALVSIDGDGQISIDVIGVAQKGKLNISVRNDDFTGEINVHVKGKISVYAEGSIDVQSVDGDVSVKTNSNVSIQADQDIFIYNEGHSVALTDSGVEIDSNKPIIVGGQFNVLYALVPDATAIVDVSEIGVSKKVKVG